MDSYVLYYNIEKSGFNAVSAYLSYWTKSMILDSYLYFKKKHLKNILFIIYM